MQSTSLVGATRYDFLVVQEERAEESVVHWDGKLQRLKELLATTVERQNDLLNELQKTFTSAIKERADRRSLELENSTQRYITGITTKADEIQTLVNLCIEKANPKVLSEVENPN